jgi:hypothetical protein
MRPVIEAAPPSDDVSRAARAEASGSERSERPKSNAAGAPERASMKAAKTSRLRRAVPFVIAIALMAVVLVRIDWNAFVANLLRVNYPAFLAFIVVFMVALLSADAFASAVIYRRTIAGLRFREFFVARGASYLPSLVNHHLGQAWLTYFLSRAYGVDIQRMAGGTLLVYASWAGCLGLLACIAFVAADLPVGWIAGTVPIGLMYLALLALKPARLANNRLLAPLFEAGVVGHLRAMAARLPHLVVLMLGTWLPFWFFGVRVPLTAALIYVPILVVGVTLPVTPLGLGTRDALATAFFERYAEGGTEAERLAAVAASTTATVVALLVVEAALGTLLLRRASRMLPE